MNGRRISTLREMELAVYTNKRGTNILFYRYDRSGANWENIRQDGHYFARILWMSSGEKVDFGFMNGNWECEPLGTKADEKTNEIFVDFLTKIAIREPPEMLLDLTRL